jgi:energy-converting hydrogenase B subunit Q
MVEEFLRRQTGTLGLVVEVRNDREALHELTALICRSGGVIPWMTVLDGHCEIQRVFFEIAGLDSLDRLTDEIQDLPFVITASPRTAIQEIFGKQLIVMGGGAQVSQVALGAVSEADRHNLRGERISVDTIPLVGEQELAEAVRAVARLPRVKALVLAGALMGGEITDAVLEVRARGIYVIALNMAGSVPEAADLVVSDPVQAGVMAVMAIADTASFSISRLSKNRF